MNKKALLTLSGLAAIVALLSATVTLIGFCISKGFDAWGIAFLSSGLLFMWACITAACADFLKEDL